MKILEKIGCSIDYAFVTHKRNLQKPNEDRLLIDKENGIVIILDGVTRVHQEYEETPYQSAAAEVGDIFLKTAHGYITEHKSEGNPEDILCGAIKAANEQIKFFRQKKSLEEWQFYPATLGIVSMLCEEQLHYAAVGDCLGVLLRGSSKMLFGKEFSLEAVDLNKVTKQERYAKYCNHPENRLSYTVYNGDEAVMSGVEYSFIHIYPGDMIILASDGIGEYLKYEKSSSLSEEPSLPSWISESSRDAEAHQGFRAIQVC